MLQYMEIFFFGKMKIDKGLIGNDLNLLHGRRKHYTAMSKRNHCKNYKGYRRGSEVNFQFLSPLNVWEFWAAYSGLEQNTLLPVSKVLLLCPADAVWDEMITSYNYFYCDFQIIIYLCPPDFKNLDKKHDHMSLVEVLLWLIWSIKCGCPFAGLPGCCAALSLFWRLLLCCLPFWGNRKVIISFWAGKDASFDWGLSHTSMSAISHYQPHHCISEAVAQGTSCLSTSFPMT